MTNSRSRQPDNRPSHKIRPLEFVPSFNRYAEGSVLVKMGHTHVLCTASVEEKVPKWLEGSGRGWVTAEYSMLPRATHTRGRRDREKVSGRTQEIQRLIGRALRAMVDLSAMDGISIIVDCDVLQADGGTRTASINGGCVALQMALKKLLDDGKLAKNPCIGSVAAVSVGLFGSEVLVDLDYDEDSSAGVDMNFVGLNDGRLVEVQGTAEEECFTQDQMNQMTDRALEAIREINQSQGALRH